jgi:large subunit ribosomal protein L19
VNFVVKNHQEYDMISMNEIDSKFSAKKKKSAFSVGDTVKVFVKISEGDKERTQTFEGIIIGFSGSGPRRTFKVRKISYGVGVERTFPIASPKIEKVEVLHYGKVRRAKLFYLRGVKGTKATHLQSDNKKIEQSRKILEQLDAGKGLEQETVQPEQKAAETASPQAQANDKPAK